jgi:hypothetical protein
MNGRAALPLLVPALLALAVGNIPAAAQELLPNELHGSSSQVPPNFALSAAQKDAIYNSVMGRRLHAATAEIPLIVGAPVPRSAKLLALPDETAGGESTQFLKYAMVDGNVVLIDSINMRVVDVIRAGAAP